MPARASRVRALAACGWLAACSTPTGRDAPASPTPPADAVDSRCSEPPPTALAVLADATCPWVLVPSDRSGLALQELALAAPRAFAVAAPDECADGCGWQGAVTEIGPVMIATRASRISEGAEAAFVGAALGGTTVRFTSLWYDRPALGDATPLGPSHALAPWVCGDRLVLAAQPRLAGAGAEELSDGLRAAAGVYEVSGDELRRSGPVPDLGACLRVAGPLP
jgi:hypothetical protein